MKSLLVLVFVGIVFANTLEKLSFFKGRSADIVLKPTKVQDNSALFLYDRFAKEYNQDSLDELDVSALVSHLVGGPISEDDSQSLSLPFSNVMDKSKANLFVTVLDSNEEQFKSAGLTFHAPKKMSLSKSFYPSDSISSLTTIATGSSPSQHGIVGADWRQETSKSSQQFKVVNAYGKSNSGRMTSSFSDLFFDAFNGRSLVVSASSSEQAARVFTSSRAAQVNGRASITAKSLLSSVYEEKRAKLLDALLEAMPDTFERQSQFQVLHKQSGVVFDSFSQDLAFLSELSMLSTVAISAQDRSKQSDSTPDLYFVTIASLSQIAEKPKRQAAFHLLHQAISKAISLMDQTYMGKFSAEVALLDKSPVVKSRESISKPTRQALESSLQSNLHSQAMFDQFFPSIYLKNGADQVGACSTAIRFVEHNSELKDNYKVICNTLSTYAASEDSSDSSSSSSSSFDKRQDQNTTTSAPTTAAPTTASPTSAPNSNTSMEIFQVVLWFSIFFVFLVFAIVWVVYDMDIDYDSNIYRATNLKLH